MIKEFILIAGGTASGKTFIAKKLRDAFINEGKTVALIEMDDYYKTLKMLNVDDSSKVNWDEPSVIDWNQLITDVNLLLSGNIIKKKKYDFNVCEYIDEYVIYSPSDIIIIEGLFALYYEELRKKATKKIYVNTDPEIRMIRRIKRDSLNRYDKDKFDLNLFINKWEKIIKPMHTKYIHPTKEFADIVLKNNFENEENKSIMTIIKSLMVK